MLAARHLAADAHRAAAECLRGTADAVTHWHAAGEKTEVLAALQDVRVLAARGAELLPVCRAVGYTTVRNALTETTGTARDARDRGTIGGFLSRLGEFAAARSELLAARDALTDPIELGRTYHAIAQNEVRSFFEKAQHKQ